MHHSDKKICVIANGCPENRNDGARIQKFLLDNGNSIVPDYREADIVIFRPCGGFKIFEEEAIAMIKIIQSNMKPTGELILCGCLSVINPAIFREIHTGLLFGAEEIDWLNTLFMRNTFFQTVSANSLLPNTLSKDLSHRPQENIPHQVNSFAVYRFLKSRILRHIPQYELIKQSLKKLKKKKLKDTADPAPGKSSSPPTVWFFTKKTAFIKISTGCPYACSYCAIRFSRGKLKSKSVNEILHEFDEGLKKGYREFALIGTETSSYGKDIGTDIVNLLNTMIKKEGDYKLRLRNFHPDILLNRFSDIEKILKSNKIDFLFSAIQSGNDRILELMNRGYRAMDVLERFASIKAKFPGVYLGTQFIVGFPSETDEEFRETMRLAQNADVDLIEVFPFEARIGTKASGLAGQIPGEVIKMRSEEFTRAIQYGHALIQNRN